MSPFHVFTLRIRVTFCDSPYQPSMDPQRSLRLESVDGAPPGLRSRISLECPGGQVVTFLLYYIYTNPVKQGKDAFPPQRCNEIMDPTLSAASARLLYPKQSQDNGLKFATQRKTFPRRYAFVDGNTTGTPLTNPLANRLFSFKRPPSSDQLSQRQQISWLSLS